MYPSVTRILIISSVPRRTFRSSYGEAIMNHTMNTYRKTSFDKHGVLFYVLNSNNRHTHDASTRFVNSSYREKKNNTPTRQGDGNSH